MKFSELFTKTQKDIKKTGSLNADFLVRGGFIDQLSSGVYTFLPLGYRVLKKIEQIVREEMEAVGGVELLMPALHQKEYWEKTDRYNLPVSFKTKSNYSGDYVLGWTHEEIITPVVRGHVNSYKDLPLYLFQIQTKFRDEPRAKSGLLRTREFSMKDLYSFHVDQKDLDRYYEKVKKAYFRIFKRCGLEKETVIAYASGGNFSKYSHEFQTICETGEDAIYLCEKCRTAVNKEIAGKKPVCPECGNKKLVPKKAIEVGNIFKLGTKFSAAFDLKYKDRSGKENLVVMGCYGIGPARIMGTVAEMRVDDEGIVWPEEIAPFDVHLIDLGGQKKEAEGVYGALKEAGIDVLWDDRSESPGVKLADGDLLGVPTRIVVSPKTAEKNKLEVKKRDQAKEKLMTLGEFLKGS